LKIGTLHLLSQYLRRCIRRLDIRQHPWPQPQYTQMHEYFSPLCSDLSQQMNRTLMSSA
jgi:hypothetical protein